MIEVSVMQAEGEKLDELISSVLARQDFDRGVLIGRYSGGKADIVAVSQNAAAKDVRCAILIAPSNFCAGVEADSVITYGLGGKDTVTVSSIGESKCMIAIRRDVITLFGGVIEEQELPVDVGGGEVEELMAAVGVLTALGIEPKNIITGAGPA